MAKLEAAPCPFLLRKHKHDATAWVEGMEQTQVELGFERVVGNMLPSNSTSQRQGLCTWANLPTMSNIIDKYRGFAFSWWRKDEQERKVGKLGFH